MMGYIFLITIRNPKIDKIMVQALMSAGAPGKEAPSVS